jgi:hypothetical protein
VANGADHDEARSVLARSRLHHLVGMPGNDVYEHFCTELAQALCFATQAALGPQHQRVGGSLANLLGPEIERMDEVKGLTHAGGEPRRDASGVSCRFRKIRSADDRHVRLLPPLGATGNPTSFKGRANAKTQRCRAVTCIPAATVALAT